MIYVCSDIHGYYDLYKKMLEEIKFSDEDTLYILGDLIDRGPDADKLVLDISSRKNVICCVGNHELLMYSHYVRDYLTDYWCYGGNGGRDTLRQFSELSEEDLDKIINYLFHETYVQIEVKLNHTYLLSHSYFIPEEHTVKEWEHYYPNYYDSPLYVTVWYSPWRHREYISQKEYLVDNRVHIIGHVPVQTIRTRDTDITRQCSSENELITRSDILLPYEKEGMVCIDGGLAHRNFTTFKNTGLICMNLTEYDLGNKDCFTYIG